MVDFDINFSNEAYHKTLGFPNQPIISEKTGRVENIFSIGTPLLWLPFFTIAQTISVLLNKLGLNVLTNGYSYINQITLGFTTIGFGYFGLYLICLSLKKIFSKPIAILTCISLLTTTQLLYYFSIDPINSHTASFLISSFILFTLIKYKDKLSYSSSALTGALIGMLGIIRSQNILLGLPIAIFLLFEQESLLKKVKKILIMFLPALFLASIDIARTYYLYGKIGNAYILHGQGLSWLRPNFIRVLFSSNNGFFRFAPISFVCIWGLIQLIKIGNKLAAVALTFFILELYIIACWVPEIIGGPYGSRMFIATLPWLSIGLAHAWKLIKCTKWYLNFSVLIIILTIYNIWQTIRMLIIW